MKSRRKIFRFGNFQVPVTFKTAYNDGTAQLVNISTGGCSLKNVSPELELGETVLLSIDIDNQEAPIEARGAVLRFDGKKVAIQFNLISDGSRNLIRTHFAELLRKQNRRNT